MKIIKEFLIGSQYFFNKFSDFQPHDKDTLYLVDSGDEKFNYLKQVTGKDCKFYMVKRPLNEHIEFALSTKPAMLVGKFLIPEIMKEFNMSINDLKKLLSLIDNLDNKHLYEKIIYDAYIQNNDFYLTDEQLNDAYQEYKKERY